MSNQSATTEQHNVDKQYDRLISLIQYYVQLTWLIFGAFLLSQTVLLGVIATAAKDGSRFFVFGAAILGLLLTLPWWSSFRYNHALYLLRIAEARKLEPQVGSCFTTGSKLIDGDIIESPIGPISIPWLSRVLSPSRSVSMLIFLYAFSFTVLAVCYWPWQCK